MINTKKILRLMAVAPLALAACGDDEGNGTGNGNGNGNGGLGNIVEVAQDAGNFGTLLQVATNLGLAPTLTEPGPFTLFAPTDTAFMDLGVDLSAVDDAVVANILVAHVAEGDLDAEALASVGSVDTLANVPHTFTGTTTPPTVRGAAVATPDIDASNGVIHALSDVIVPPTILEAAGELGFTELAGAVGAASAGIAEALDPDTLGGAAPITVFAPTDAAFQAADLAGEDLDAVLSYHAAAGQALAEDLEDGQMVTTVQGADITVNIDGAGAVTLTDARGNTVSVTETDVRTLRGVIHVIDGVLLPPQ